MLSDTEEKIEYIKQEEGIISLKLQEGVKNNKIRNKKNVKMRKLNRWDKW